MKQKQKKANIQVSSTHKQLSIMQIDIPLDSHILLWSWHSHVAAVQSFQHAKMMTMMMLRAELVQWQPGPLCVFFWECVEELLPNWKLKEEKENKSERHWPKRVKPGDQQCYAVSQADRQSLTTKKVIKPVRSCKFSATNGRFIVTASIKLPTSKSNKMECEYGVGD